MDKLMGVAVGGFLALITLFSLIGPVANSMGNAQMTYEPLSVTDAEVSTDIAASGSESYSIEITDTNTTHEVEVITTEDVEWNVSRSSSDGVTDEQIASGTGDGTVEFGEEIQSGDYGIVVDAENTNTTDSQSYEHTVSVETERENAGLYAIVLLIFLMAFAMGIWKAIG